MGNSLAQGMAGGGSQQTDMADQANNRTALNAVNMGSDPDYYAPSYSHWPDQTGAETARLARSGNAYGHWPDQTTAEAARLANMARPTPQVTQVANAGEQPRSSRPAGETASRAIAAGVASATPSYSNPYATRFTAADVNALNTVMNGGKLTSGVALIPGAAPDQVPPPPVTTKFGSFLDRVEAAAAAARTRDNLVAAIPFVGPGLYQQGVGAKLSLLDPVQAAVDAGRELENGNYLPAGLTLATMVPAGKVLKNVDGVVDATKRTDNAFKDFNQAQNAALDWLEGRGFKAEQATLGKFGDNASKPIGMKSLDGKSGFRVEFDERHGAHINVWSGKQKDTFNFVGNQPMVDQIVKQFVKEKRP